MIFTIAVFAAAYGCVLRQACWTGVVVWRRAGKLRPSADRARKQCEVLVGPTSMTQGFAPTCASY
eukprot:7426430-Pyramimonas_sp.AAC.1